MSDPIKPEIDKEKILARLADCMVQDEWGFWYDKQAAEKVLGPLFDDSQQNDTWAAEIRTAEANTRKAMELQQITNAQLQEAIRQRDEVRAQLETLRGALMDRADISTQIVPK